MSDIWLVAELSDVTDIVSFRQSSTMELRPGALHMVDLRFCLTATVSFFFSWSTGDLDHCPLGGRGSGGGVGGRGMFLPPRFCLSKCMEWTWIGGGAIGLDDQADGLRFVMPGNRVDWWRCICLFLSFFPSSFGCLLVC